MNAVIHQLPDPPGVGLLPIAGRPLIARQIQWLRTIGCTAIAVEIASDTESAEIARFLAEEDAIGAGVSLVLTRRVLTSREIARRAGFSDAAPLLAIPADVLAGGELGAPIALASALSARTLPPRELAGRLEGGQIYFVPAGSAAPISVEILGWAVRVRSLREAMAFGAAVLDGNLATRPEDPSGGVQIHAAEIEPGVWVGRGVVIASGAEIAPPVLIGAGAIVCAGARVGPRVCVGDRAVIGADTSIRDAIVSSGTIVGEGLMLADVVVEPHGLVDPDTGEMMEIEDDLILAERDRGPRAGILTRAISLMMLIVLLPFAAIRRIFPTAPGDDDERHATVLLDRRLVVLTRGGAGIVTRLIEAARGQRVLIGVSAWTGPWPEDVSTAVYQGALSAPQGIFAVDEALVPPGAEPVTQLIARSWYAHAKSFRVDMKLLIRCLSASLSRKAG